MSCHAIERARERYGLELTTRDLKKIAGKIKSGEAVLQGRKEDGSTWIVKWNDGVLRVFLFLGGFVVTVLPQTRHPKHKAGWRKTSKQHECGRVRDRDENWRDEIW